MIVLLSPAKTFTKELKKGITFPFFKEKSNKLVDILKSLDAPSLKETLKISDRLTKTVYGYYQNYNLKYAAVYLYGGQAYKYLKANEIDEKRLKDLYILCPLYGILNALDKIGLYRLDIKDKLLDISLYEYWYENINNYLNSLKSNLIINLSSGEFSKLLDLEADNLITINFGVIKEGKITMPSMLIKKMRGMMANYLLKNNIDEIKEITKINLDGFHFSAAYSNEKTLFFTKNI